MTRQSSQSLFKAISYIGIYGGLLMPLVFIPIVIFPFVFSKLIALQVLIGLTFPAYVALAWMNPVYRPPKSALYTAIIAYFGAVLLSVIFSVDPHRSWWGNQERMNGLFTLLHFFAWLTMTIGVMKRWEPWKKLLNYEVVLSVIMAIVAILQRWNPDLLSFRASERVGGLLDNPIYMGCYQIFNLSFLTLLFLKTKNKTIRILYVVAALIDLIAFFLTQSRGALFGLLATVGIFTVYYAFFTPSKRVRWSILGGAAGVFGLYALAYIYRASTFIASNSILARLTNLQATTSTRLIAWEIAWKGFLERPLTGWGFDAFYILFNLKYNPKSLEFGYYETWFDRAHNTIMDTLAMTGLFGFITYLAIFITLVLIVWRAHKKGWIDLPIAAILVALPIGYFLQNLFVFDHPAAFSMSYLLFAFVIVATRPMFIGLRDEEETQVSEKGTHDAPWIAFTILQLLLFVVVWNCSVRPFKASMMAIQANGMLGAVQDAKGNFVPGRITQGVALMKSSLEMSSLYDGEQTFLTSRDVIDLAGQGVLTKEENWKEVYKFAKDININYLAKHPRDTNQMFIQARLLHTMFPYMTEVEATAEARLTEEYYLKSIETSPKRQQLYFGLARLYSQLGQSQKTYDTLKQAVEFDDQVGESWWYFGLVSMLDLAKVDEGADAIIKSQTVKTPYAYQTVSDAIQIAHAASYKKDTDLLKKILERLPTLGGGSIAGYLEIARSMEKSNLLEERNVILNALVKADPSLVDKLKPLSEGTVQTIDESLALMTTSTAPVAVQSSSTTDVASSTPDITSSTNQNPASTTQAESNSKLVSTSSVRTGPRQ